MNKITMASDGVPAEAFQKATYKASGGSKLDCVRFGRHSGSYLKKLPDVHEHDTKNKSIDR